VIDTPCHIYISIQLYCHWPLFNGHDIPEDDDVRPKHVLITKIIKFDRMEVTTQPLQLLGKLR
jgi:hypothetical protein